MDRQEMISKLQVLAVELGNAGWVGQATILHVTAQMSKDEISEYELLKYMLPLSLATALDCIADLEEEWAENN